MSSRTPIRIRELAVHSVLLVVLLTILYPAAFFGGEIVIPSDLIYDYEPWKYHKPEGFERPDNNSVFDFLSSFNADYLMYRKALDAGEWPLWNHLEYTGMPLAANYQSSVFYFPRLYFAFFEHYLAINLYILTKVFLCGMTAYLCGRGVGLSIPMSRLLSVGWMLGGYNIHWYYYPLPDVAAWLPLVFLGAEWILEGRRRNGFIMLTVGATFLLIAGHPETAFSMGFGLGLYFLLRLALKGQFGKPFVQPIGIALGAWLLAVAVCAVQLIPFGEYVLNSHTFLGRQEGGLAEQYFRWAAVVAFWVPRFFGAYADGTFWGWPPDESRSAILNLYRPNSNYVSLVYPGVVMWVGVAMLALPGPKSKTMRHRLVAVGVVAVVELLLATKSPVVSFVNGLPPFNAMWTVYHVAFVAFALTVFGAIGLDHWFARARSYKSLAYAVPVFALAAIVIAVVFTVNRATIVENEVTSYIVARIVVFALFAAVGMAILAGSIEWRRPRLFQNAFVLLLTCDLLVMAWGVNYTAPRERLFPETPFIEKLKDHTAGRRVGLVQSELSPGIAQVFDVEQLWGHDGIIPHRIMAYIFKLTPCAWDKMEPLCAVQHYLFKDDLIPALANDPNLALVDQADGYAIYDNLRAMPRAYLVGGLEVVDSEAAIIGRMCEPSFDPLAAAVTEQPPDTPYNGAPGRPEGRAEVVHRAIHSVDIEVDAARESILVLSDAYYPGWKARIDGERAEVFPVYYAFRGVIVPEGPHTVTYRYEPASFRIGLAVSTITLLGCLAWGLRDRMRRRNA